MNNSIKEQVAVMANDIAHIKCGIDEIKIDLRNLDRKYASKTTERIVYGLVTLVMIAFLTKILSLW